MTHERVHRWDIALIAALVLSAFGILRGTTIAIVAAIIPLTYVLVGALNRPPETPQLTMHREVDGNAIAPGEHVPVRLHVTNDGADVLTDVRVIDGVPDALAATDGSPRAGVSLRPGEEAVIEYTLVARCGTYEFDDPYVRLRTYSGAHRWTARVAAMGETAFKCRLPGVELPMRVADTSRTGSVTTETPGQGLDFYATREYRSTDPRSHIDWRHYAKNGELTTIQFREQRTASAMLVVDARPNGRVTAEPGHPDGLELTTYAASRAANALLQNGTRVGATALGISGDAIDAIIDTDRAGVPWVDVGTGPETRARLDAVINACRTDDDTAETRVSNTTGRATATADGGVQLATRFAERLDANTQLVVASPLLDDDPVDLVRRLRVEGYEVTVITPDITGGSGWGGSVTAVERRVRLTEMRSTGATVIDWEPSDPLPVVLETRLGGLH